MCKLTAITWGSVGYGSKCKHWTELVKGSNCGKAHKSKWETVEWYHDHSKCPDCLITAKVKEHGKLRNNTSKKAQEDRAKLESGIAKQRSRKSSLTVFYRAAAEAKAMKKETYIKTKQKPGNKGGKTGSRTAHRRVTLDDVHDISASHAEGLSEMGRKNYNDLVKYVDEAVVDLDKEFRKKEARSLEEMNTIKEANKNMLESMSLRITNLVGRVGIGEEDDAELRDKMEAFQQDLARVQQGVPPKGPQEQTAQKESQQDADSETPDTPPEGDETVVVDEEEQAPATAETVDGEEEKAASAEAEPSKDEAKEA